MCAENWPYEQTSFRARRHERLGQFGFEAEPFEFSPTDGEWETAEWEAEDEGEVRRRRAKPYLRRYLKRRRRRIIKPPFPRFPRWPFVLPSPLPTGVVPQPGVEKPPPAPTPSAAPPERASGGAAPAAEPDTEPPDSAEPAADNEPAAEPTTEPAADDKPTEDPQEEVAPWSLPAPRLIKPENQPAQTTLYVEIKLKNVHRKTGKPVAPITGIYIPAGFKPQATVDVILYLHGYDLTGCNRTIETYWRTKCQPHFPLREGVNASGKNVILVAPTLGSRSESGILTQDGALDNYLDQVVAALKAHGPYRGMTPRIGNLILACHSGGGYPMRQIALANNRYGSQIRECWGFDCTYNTGDETLWAQWIKRKPQARLYIYYRPNSGTAPRAEKLKRQNLPNIFVEASRQSHNYLPITYWKTRLRGAEFLKEK